ncbi:MAG: T9SS type A sorting domain-containing protein, partial [bacterium]|nr:T9SS type A sorting domain-containing protein [Candidatus Kapabacteria bacterium]
ERIRLEYSTDGGSTWTKLLAGVVSRLGADIGSYMWTVPNIDAPNALVRVVNDERTRFTDVSDMAFEIVTGRLAVLAPNGGERFELNQPMTVRFDAPHSQTLRLDYSSDGGSTWLTIDRTVDAGGGTHTFTPAGIPTKRGMVRLVDESRASLVDVSDGFFEIMEAASIVIFNPTQGEQIMRSSVYPITWQANRIARVNIEYSATGGAPGSWSRIASDVNAATGSHNWMVPSQNTAMGVIRISEVGGTIVGESGQFSIITPVTSVRLIRPNGGEVYTTGDDIIIGWSAVNIPTVTFEYSSDGGASWNAIAGVTVPSSQGTYRWTAPNSPSKGYRLKVVGGAFSDMSDAEFEIARRIVPSITVSYPNGGERLAVDSTINIRWVAADIAGDVTIAYSIDNGGNWIDIATAPANPGVYAWTIPSTVSESALVRVVGSGGVTDISNAAFAIEMPIVRTLSLSSPNAPTVVWREGEMATVTWTAQNVGTDVAIVLSTDNGATWPTVMTPSVSAATGTYSWQVPHLSNTSMSTLRVRVATLDGLYSDTSDASFTYEPVIAGIETPTTGGAGLRLSGAYPNPFATETEVRWLQAAAGMMTLRVYAQTGALVSEYAMGRLESGAHTARIDAALLPAGLYIYELRSEREAVRGTMTVVR